MTYEHIIRQSLLNATRIHGRVPFISDLPQNVDCYGSFSLRLCRECSSIPHFLRSLYEPIYRINTNTWPNRALAKQTTKKLMNVTADSGHHHRRKYLPTLCAAGKLNYSPEYEIHPMVMAWLWVSGAEGALVPA